MPSVPTVFSKRHLAEVVDIFLHHQEIILHVYKVDECLRAEYITSAINPKQEVRGFSE